jgi:hypothetical protein
VFSCGMNLIANWTNPGFRSESPSPLWHIITPVTSGYNGCTTITRPLGLR